MVGDYTNPNTSYPLAFPNENVPGISLPADFGLEPADRSLLGPGGVTPAPAPNPQPAAPAGPIRFPSRDPKEFGEAIARLVGAFSGPGFNLIFRPHGDKTPPEKQKDIKLPRKHLLELNLTHELWTFPTAKANLGKIFNRVAGTSDKDAILRGVPYTQLVRDVTATAGKFAGQRIPVTRLGEAVDPTLQGDVEDIHFEPGLLIHVPPSTPNPDKPTICRMASIPHGTTINAQGEAATKVDGKSEPDIPVSQTASKPFSLKTAIVSTKFDDDQFNVNNAAATRLPQDLLQFKNNLITQDLINDPNNLLKTHNAGKTFSQTIKFKVSTTPVQKLAEQACPHLAARNAMNNAVASIKSIIETATLAPNIKDALRNTGNTLAAGLNTLSPPTDSLPNGPAIAPAIGTANIAFLDGALGKEPNASTAKVESTFWISTVVYTIEVKTRWEPELANNAPKLGPNNRPTKVLMVDPIQASGFAPDTVPRFVFPADKPVE